MDEAIPQSFRSWILCLLGVLGTLCVICVATPIFTAVIPPLAIFYFFVQVTLPKSQQKQEIKEMMKKGCKTRHISMQMEWNL